MNAIATATATQVRAWYINQGYEVKTDMKGHIKFRIPGQKEWLEGRNVREYRIDLTTRNVHLT